MVHAQFETIHPFLDGNGRVGRLLITFLLVHGAVLHRPLLYLSYFLKRHRSEYYDRLMAVRHDGDWEGWIGFFLRGIAEAAAEATSTAEAIVRLREGERATVLDLGANGIGLLDLLYQQPVTNVAAVRSAYSAISATCSGSPIPELAPQLPWVAPALGLGGLSGLGRVPWSGPCRPAGWPMRPWIRPLAGCRRP